MKNSLEIERSFTLLKLLLKCLRPNEIRKILLHARSRVFAQLLTFFDKSLVKPNIAKVYKCLVSSPSIGISEKRHNGTHSRGRISRAFRCR